MKKQNYELGGLDAIPDGALLNAKQISQVLGISLSTARKMIIAEGFKTIRFSSAENSSVFIKAGELKLFLDKGGAEPTENVESLVDTIAAANAEPNAEKNVTSAEPTDADFEFAMAAAAHSKIIGADAQALTEPTGAPAAEPTPPQSKGEKPKYLPPAERPPRVDVDFNKYVDTRGSWDFINAELAQRRKGENPKPKSADEALKKAGVERWSKGKEIKGYGGKS